MFTGIIQKVGRVLETHAQTVGENELLFRIDSRFSDVQLGESIAINGVCLTVVEFSAGSGAETGEGWMLFHVSSETLARSNLGSLRPGSRVNLERALLAADRLSGHIVQGHVDGLARFTRAGASGESFEVSFELPEELASYCVEKGSIALNGVSLTINSVQGCEIGITLIPHTWRHTNFSSLSIGDAINVEIDIFAKYARKFAGAFTENSCQTSPLRPL